jgi:hypothetical protein
MQNPKRGFCPLCRKSRVEVFLRGGTEENVSTAEPEKEPEIGPQQPFVPQVERDNVVNTIDKGLLEDLRNSKIAREQNRPEQSDERILLCDEVRWKVDMKHIEAKGPSRSVTNTVDL